MVGRPDSSALKAQRSTTNIRQSMQMSTQSMTDINRRLSEIEALLRQLERAQVQQDNVTALAGQVVSGWRHVGREVAVTKHFKGQVKRATTPIVAYFQDIELLTEAPSPLIGDPADGGLASDLERLLGPEEFGRLRTLAIFDTAAVECLHSVDILPPSELTPITHTYADDHLNEKALKLRLPGLVAIGRKSLMFHMQQASLAVPACISGMLYFIDDVFRALQVDLPLDVDLFTLPDSLGGSLELFVSSLVREVPSSAQVWAFEQLDRHAKSWLLRSVYDPHEVPSVFEALIRGI